MKARHFPLFFFVWLHISLLAQAQVTTKLHSLELSGSNKSAEEIRALVETARSKGLSDSEIFALAKQQGLSLSDIIKFQSTPPSEKPVVADGSERVRQASPDNVEKSKEPPLVESSAKPNVYGSYLFKNPNLTFTPDINIATPTGYVIGPGDEVIIDIWGASEMTYRQLVSPSGVIRISGVGPVFVNGFTIEEARKKIISRLSKIYSGLSRKQVRKAKHICRCITWGPPKYHCSCNWGSSGSWHLLHKFSLSCF